MRLEFLLKQKKIYTLKHKLLVFLSLSLSLSKLTLMRDSRLWKKWLLVTRLKPSGGARIWPRMACFRLFLNTPSL